MPSRSQAKTATVLGWLVGGGAAVLLNFVLFQIFGEGYPVAPTSFGLFVAGAFGGMWLADRLGARAVRVLGIATGVLLGLALVVVVMISGSR
ncbi:MAG: hypothetical protein KF901_06490 [Myxococcales bacterium]|nr:hypothetical protein [Myxococcales bacterium]